MDECSTMNYTYCDKLKLRRILDIRRGVMERNIYESTDRSEFAEGSIVRDVAKIGDQQL